MLNKLSQTLKSIHELDAVQTKRELCNIAQDMCLYNAAENWFNENVDAIVEKINNAQVALKKFKDDLKNINLL